MGLDTLENLVQESNFPWILSNVLDANTFKPICNLTEKKVIKFNGLKIGLFGLAEKDWVKSLACVNYDNLIFESYVHEAKRIATELRTKDVSLLFIKKKKSYLHSSKEDIFFTFIGM